MKRFPTPFSSHPLRLVAMLATLLLVLTACGSDDDATVATDPPDADATVDDPADADDPEDEVDDSAEDADDPEDPVETDEEVEEPADAAAEDPFEGETIRILMPFQPGGGAYETAQFLTQELPGYLPGESTSVQLEVLTGGGGSLAMQELVNSGSDGLSMVVTSNGVIGRWLSGTEGHDYPLEEMHPIGTTSQGIVMLVRNDLAPDLDSLREITSPANISGSAPGSAIHWMETLTGEAFEFPINHVFGYEGQGPQVVALESNEVQILSAAKPVFEESWGRLIEEGIVWPMYESGVLDADRNMINTPGPPEGLPTILDFYREELGEPDPELLEEFEIIGAMNSLLFPAFMAPDAQQDRLDAIRDAFTQMEGDPEFSDRAIEFFGLEYPFTGPEGHEAIMDLILGRPDALERLISRL